MGQIHCITPPRIVAKIRYMKDALINERRYWTESELRRIALLDFELKQLPNGQPIASFPPRLH